MSHNEPVPEPTSPMRTSVSFEYHTHRVEYGAMRPAGSDPYPFVSVDGVDVVLTPELRNGWEQQQFGKAVLSYMKLNYSPSQE